MGDSELSGARARIEVAEKKLAALQDVGIDVTHLRAQLNRAGDRIQAQDAHEALSICDEVLTAAKKMAKGQKRAKTDVNLSGLADAWNSDRANSGAHEQVREELRRMLNDDMVGTIVQQHLAVAQKEGEARLQEMVRQLREQFARELAQVMATKPWDTDIHRLKAANTANQTAYMDGIQVVKSQMEALQKETQAALKQKVGKPETQKFKAADSGSAEALKKQYDELAKSMQTIKAQIAEMQQDTGFVGDIVTNQIAASKRETDIKLQEAMAVVREQFSNELAQFVATKPWDSVATDVPQELHDELQAMKTHIAELKVDSSTVDGMVAHHVGLVRNDIDQKVNDAILGLRERLTVELKDAMAAKPWETALHRAIPKAPAGSADLREEVDAVKARLDLEHKEGEERLQVTVRQLREQFARELAQVIASKPWESGMHRMTAASKEIPPVLADEISMLKTQIGDLRREVSAKDSWYSPDDIRMLLDSFGALSKPVTDAVENADEPPTVLAPMDQTALGKRVLELEAQLKALMDKLGSAKVAGDADDEDEATPESTSDWLLALDDSTAPKGPTQAAERHKTPPPKSPPVEMGAETTSNISSSKSKAIKPETGPGYVSSEPLTPIAAQSITGKTRKAVESDAMPGMPLNDGEFRRRLTQFIPEVLRQPPIQSTLFAIIALEATAQPNALGELTGLRSFLRKEVGLIADQIRKELAAEVG